MIEFACEPLDIVDEGAIRSVDKPCFGLVQVATTGSLNEDLIQHPAQAARSLINEETVATAYKSVTQLGLFNNDLAVATSIETWNEGFMNWKDEGK